MEGLGFVVVFLIGGVVGFMVCDRGKKKIKAQLANLEKKYDSAKNEVQEVLKKKVG